MRFAFGLAGVLIVLGVVIVVMSNYTLPAAKQATQTKKKVEEQFGGNTSAGLADQKASITITDMTTSGGKFDGLYVQGIVAGGFMQTKFGLAKDDIITDVGPYRLRDHDPDSARDFLWEARLRAHDLKVIRNQQEIMLSAK